MKYTKEQIKAANQQINREFSDRVAMIAANPKPPVIYDAAASTPDKSS